MLKVAKKLYIYYMILSDLDVNLFVNYHNADWISDNWMRRSISKYHLDKHQPRFSCMYGVETTQKLYSMNSI